VPVPLAVESIGHRVPRTGFSGRVHSVFVRACNIACDDALLTLVAADLGDGPTLLRLARDAPRDLRAYFEVGEPVDGRHHGARTARTEVQWTRASVWSPAPLRALLPGPRIHAHVSRALHRLAQHRSTHPSLIDVEGAPVTAALRHACQALDGQQVVRHVDRLIGWGEGLTPAGDDFLVGLTAGLDAFVDGPQRRELRGAIAAVLRSATPRTTPIAAHYLRLAADDHYTEPLLRVRDALLCEDDDHVVDAALHTALDVGATSGADTVSGLLAGLTAWLPVASTAESA
jgi:hypothetical protein